MPYAQEYEEEIIKLVNEQEIRRSEASRIQPKKAIVIDYQEQQLLKNVEISKTGIYLAGNYKILTRLAQDFLDTIDVDVKLDTDTVGKVASVGHVLSNLAYLKFTGDYITSSINTVLFSLRIWTDLLESDNALIQASIDVSSATFTHLVTFNIPAAIISGTLTASKHVAKYLVDSPELQSEIILGIDTVDAIVDCYSASNVVIKSVEVLRIGYDMYDEYALLRLTPEESIDSDLKMDL